MTVRPLAELIDRHAAALVLYARQWCGTPDDVVQEAFCRFVAQRKPPTDPAAWLFRVVRNAAMDAGKADRRRRTRESRVAKVEWFAEAEVEGLDAEDAIAALESLPPDQREVIVARLWGGLTLEQVAASAGCSVSSAHRRYEAGIAALRERLGVECPKKM
ncbi:RNA polymerase sigma factor [Limnoglobus roseus]|uniref:Sigma-70 family RNA polymerase sigma factor n=1 Tax=Limnoglobus roseus TaxID=2598579 RepID=A0A5C1AGL1_9BACT|nr:sigma-70 family RNA polymerase sigma factor [Limnoglobus roseus]QEL17287.1 sigma-70 family RNA polymerase sigma factor [Limnoglobus roseus]